MKIKLFILLWGLLGSNVLDAQIFLDFGGGYAKNHVKQNLFGNYGGSNVKADGGVCFYAHVRVKEVGSLLILSGLEFIKKNHSIYRYDILNQRSKNLYLVLPITIQLNLLSFGKFEILGGAGFDVGYWTSRVIEGYIPNAFSSSYRISSNGIIMNELNVSEYIIKNDFSVYENRLELSAKVGLQIQYRYNNTISPVFNLNFRDALSSTSKDDTMIGGKFNRTVILSIGSLLKL